MKKILLILTAILLFAGAKASHILCQTLTVQYTGTPNVYMVKAYTYRDCAGIPVNPLLALNYNDSSMGASYNIVNMPLTGTQVMPVFTCAPFTPFLCSNGFGIEVAEYSLMITLPFQSTSWHFWTSECCRSGAITTVNAPSSAGAFIEARLDNLNYPTNSLPDFSIQNVPVFCVNQPAVYPNTATDADGDSIVYSLINARDYTSPGTGIPLIYLPPYNSLNFISSSTPIYFDSTSGVAAFTPDVVQQGILVVLAEEYRNGVKIGSSMRDINVMVVQGINNPSTIQGTVYLDANANGVQDSSEYGVANEFVQSNPFYAYNVTDTAGAYTMYIGTGPHTVEVANTPSWFTVNPASHAFNFSTAGNLSAGNDFGLVPVPGTTELEVSLSVQAVRPQVRSMLYLSARNNGSDPAAGIFTLTLPDSVSFDSASVQPSLINGNDVSWTLSTLQPLLTRGILVWVIADSGLVIGDSVYFCVQLTANPGTDILPANNTSCGWADVVNSYDPNTKTVFPSGSMPVADVLSGEPLTYRIDFENTGVADAINVVVKDVLPVELQLSSVQVLASSFPYNVRINYPRELQFDFNGINLAPVLTDPANSRGYIIFRATPWPSTPAGTLISNSAKIYFDNNLPIQTPTAEVLIVSSTTGITDWMTSASPALHIAPNPATEQVSVSLPSGISGTVELVVYTLDGKIVQQERTQRTGSEMLRMDVHDLTPGMYLLVARNGQGSFTGRLLRNP